MRSWKALSHEPLLERGPFQPVLHFQRFRLWEYSSLNFGIAEETVRFEFDLVESGLVTEEGSGGLSGRNSCSSWFRGNRRAECRLQWCPPDCDANVSE